MFLSARVLKILLWLFLITLGPLSLIFIQSLVRLKADIPLILPENRVQDAYSVFKKLDVDQDGRLSFAEFLMYDRYYVMFMKEDFDRDEFIEYTELPVEDGDNVVQVQAFYTPLNLSSLSKDMKSIPVVGVDSFTGLLNWKEPFKKELNLSAKWFSVFMPPRGEAHTPGAVWWVVKPQLDKYIGQLPSSRYFPPAVEDQFRPIFALLQMFHPRPFLRTRFSPQGTVAVLRAVGETFFDIFFRIHAEFQLNVPPLFAFWFTPAQFSGRLVISKDALHVYHFHMEVPAHRKLNVDMEWLNGPTEDSMEVDIGHIPEMKLVGQTGYSLDLIAKELFESEREHVKAISEQEAQDAVEKTFYPFKQVRYYNLSEAFQVAQSESKLMHGLLLWGALDDQSC